MLNDLKSRLAIVRFKDWGIQNGIFLLGAFFSGDLSPTNWGFLAVSLVVSCLCLAHGYGLNEYFDVLKDELKGDTRTAARFYRIVYVYLVLALGVSWFVSQATFVMVALIGVTAWFHSSPPFYLKSRIFWRLFLNSLGFAFFFLTGAALDNRLTTGELLMGGFIFGLYLPLELIHVLAHMESDKTKGLRTFPFVYGEKKTIILAMVILAVLVLFAGVLWRLRMMTPAFAAWSGGNLALLCLFLGMAFGRKNSRLAYEKLRLKAKVICLVYGTGMLAILLWASWAGKKAMPAGASSTPSASGTASVPGPAGGQKASSLPLRFPQDEGVHRDQPIEWWYLNSQFADASGKKYAFFFTVFSNGRHLVSLFDKTADAAPAKGYQQALSAANDKLALSSDSLQWQQTGAPFNYQFSFNLSGVVVNLTLKSNKKPFLPGGEGFIGMGLKGTSYYYALTDLTLAGTLQIGTNQTKISGKAWIDHQWGAWDWANDFSQWKWYSVQLDNGTDLMLFNFYKDKTLIRSHCGFIDRDNRQSHQLPCQLVTRQYYTDARGGKWQKEVDLEIAGLPDTKLILTSENDQQFIEPFVVWEGSMEVGGTFKGSAVKGTAYGELNRPD